ncbi:unnamed protein product, partial [Porites evermanni]
VGLILQFHLPGSNSLSCKPVKTDSVYTIKSFKTDKYLKVEWKNNTTKLSFTGNSNDCGIYFLPRKIPSTNEYTISLDNKTNYYLAIEHGKLVVKKMNPPLKECRFQLRRISLNYSRGDNRPVSEDYHVVVSMSTNNSEYNAITSNRFGKVSLGYWKDCRAWFNISLAI